MDQSTSLMPPGQTTLLNLDIDSARLKQRDIPRSQPCSLQGNHKLAYQI